MHKYSVKYYRLKLNYLKKERITNNTTLDKVLLFSFKYLYIIYHVLRSPKTYLLKPI